VGGCSQVFTGLQGAPAQCFPAAAACGGPYTTVAASPVTREAPFLYVDSRGRYNVFVPAPRHDSSGTSWGSGPTAGVSIPLTKFMVASPAVSIGKINQALASGRNLLLTPGTYAVDKTIQV